MKSALWLAAGVGIGFVVAHQVNRTPRGRAFFADLDARTREFTDGIADGYRSRDAELRETTGGDDTRASDARASDARASDARASDAQQDDPRTDDTQTDDARTDRPRTDDAAAR